MMKKLNSYSLPALMVLFCLVTPVVAQQRGWFRGGADEAERIRATPLLVELDSPADGRLEIVVPSFDDKLYVYNHDGTMRSGWPVTLTFGDGTIASPAAGDVDGDGELEIVVGGDDANSKNAQLRVYEADGTLRAQLSLSSNANASLKATPCLFDCYKYSGSTPHPALEIIVRDGDGQLHAVYWNGSALVDLFVNNDTYKTVFDNNLKDRFGSQPITGSVTAVDLNTSTTYLVAGSTDGKLYRWNATSTSSANWNLQALNAFAAQESMERFYGSAIAADLNEDGEPELIAGTTGGRLYVWDGADMTSGTLLDGWPQPSPAAQPFVCSPAVADINGDGNLEILIGNDDGQVYAFQTSGTLLSGWPQATGGNVFAAPAAAEIDGEEGLEVVAGSLDGWLYAWQADGTPLPDWPKRMNTLLYSASALGDIHGGGRQAIVFGGYDGRVFVFDLAGKTLDGSAGWRQFRGNMARSGTANSEQ